MSRAPHPETEESRRSHLEQTTSPTLPAGGLIPRAVERLYLSLGGTHPCRVHLDPDLFDGRAYTIDGFYSACRPFFDRPWYFYRDFLEGRPLELREARTPGVRRTYTPYVFDSPVQTPWRENNRVPFKWFTQPGERARTLLLFIPGWGRVSQSFEEGMCARLAARGIDAGLLTKPFHQARAPAGSRSGEYFISPNLFWTVANFRQLTAEIRVLTRYMRERYDYVGLIGMSSGGFHAGLASDCDRVDFLFTLLGGCDLGGVTWHGAATQWVRRELQARGVDEAALRRAWSIADQAVLGRHCLARYRKHYIAKFDSVVPYDYQVRLWDVYGRPDRQDLDASHVSTYFSLSRIVDDVAAFVHRCI